MNRKWIAVTLLATCGLCLEAVAVDLPDFGEAKITAERKVAVTRYIEQKEIRTVTTPLPAGLKITTGPNTTVGPVSRSVMATVVVTQTDYLELDNVVARRINGDPVSKEVVAKELANSTPVILFEEDRPIPMPIAKLFTPSALVLVIPPLEAPSIIIPPPTERR